jgi:hypothetical protein
MSTDPAVRTEHRAAPPQARVPFGDRRLFPSGGGLS